MKSHNYIFVSFPLPEYLPALAPTLLSCGEMASLSRLAPALTVEGGAQQSFLPLLALSDVHLGPSSARAPPFRGLLIPRPTL